jgi:hypothetical protein
VADALSGLDIDGLRIQQEEAFTFLPETEHSSIEFPIHHTPCTMHHAHRLDIQRAGQSPRSQRNGIISTLLLYATHDGYDLLCYKDKICIPQSLR